MIVTILSMIIAFLGTVIVPILLALFYYWNENKKNKTEIDEKIKDLDYKMKTIEQKEKEINLLETQIKQKDLEFEIEKHKVEAFKESFSEMDFTAREKNAITTRYTNYIIEKDQEAKNKGIIDLSIEILKKRTSEAIADGIFNLFTGD